MIKFVLLYSVAFNLMADYDTNASHNFFIADLKKAKELNQIKIKKIDNLNIVSQPDGILETINSNKNSEILFQVNNEFSFNEIIVSLSADLNKSDVITTSVIADEEEFSLGNFSIGRSRSFSRRNNIGSIAIDTVRFDKKKKKFDIRIKIYNNSSERIKIKLINLVLTDTDAKISSPERIKNKNIKIKVPKISQMIQQVNYNEDICSPTSLTMVLNYYGINVDTITTASGVIDVSENIYGNWIFNTMFASTKKLYSFVSRLNSYDELYVYLSKKIPVIASITFGPGELKKSPIKKTKGHLVVIKGIDESGNIIVNDPAAKNNDLTEIVYDADEFSKAWFKNKCGTSYIIVDDIFKLLSTNIPYSEMYSEIGEKLTQITSDEKISFIKKEGEKIIVDVDIQKVFDDKKKLIPYRGYIQEYHFSLPQYFNSIIKSKLAYAYDHNKKNILILSAGNKISVLSETDNFYLASVSNILFYLKKDDILKFEDMDKDKNKLRKKIIEFARNFIGTKYDWGGRSFNGIDCSGLVSVVYKIIGIEIPRNAREQFEIAYKIKKTENLMEGDLIFSTKENLDYIEHVMIYSGNGQIIEATKDSESVREVDFFVKFNKDIKNVRYGERIGNKKIYFGGFISQRDSERTNTKEKK